MTGDRQALKRLRHLAGRAIHKYGLIQEGDRLAVGVSGGKDSLVLIKFLAGLRARAPVKFQLGVIHLEPGPGVPGLSPAALAADLGRMRAWLAELPLDFLHLEPAPEVPEMAAWQPGHPSPCWNCSRLRRARLFDLCRHYRANRLALGHHLDDAIETLLMNIFHSGKMEGLVARQQLFEASTPMRNITDAGARPGTCLQERRPLTIIRPLILTPEDLVRNLAIEAGLPVLPRTCPADGRTTRQTVKELVASLIQGNPKIRGNLASVAEAAGLGPIK